MKQISSKITKTILFCLIISLSSCTEEKSSADNFVTNEESKIANAKNWFENYKAKGLIDPKFKGVDYHWDEATITLLTDNTTAITIPLTNNNVDVKHKGNYFLYLQSLGKSYNAVFYELIHDQHNNTSKLADPKPPIELEEVIIHSSGGSNNNYSVTINYLNTSIGTSIGTSNAGGISGGSLYGGSGSGGSSASVAGAIAFLNSIKTTNTDPFEIEYIQEANQEGINQVTAKLKIQITPVSVINIAIIQKVGNPNTIENVVSSTSGIILGYSWTQEYFTQSKAKNIITLNVTGTFTLGTGLQGIGDFYSTLYTYQIKIDNRTGKIISGGRI